MRTTLDIDEKLITKAMKITGEHTKTALIHFALEQIIRKSNLKSLLEYGGKIHIDYDINASRGRT